MTRKTGTVLALVLIGIASNIQVTLADPVILPTGSLTVKSGHLSFAHANDDPDVQGGLFGDGFSLQLRSFFFPGPRPTSSENPFVAFPSFSTLGDVEPGDLRIGDKELSFTTDSQLRLSVSAPSVHTRTISDRLSGAFVITYPFQLTGLLAGPTIGEDSFEFQIRGQGIGQSEFLGGCCQAQFSELTFTAPAPTPEPASMVLVATGAMWFLRLARRRSRATPT
jgi:hypothetical protein